MNHLLSVYNHLTGIASEFMQGTAYINFLCYRAGKLTL